jgi:hypothetical protein
MVDETSECPQGLTFLEAFTITGKSTPSALYAKDATTGACEPGEPVSPTLTYLRLGEAVAPTEFPEIERTLRQ